MTDWYNRLPTRLPGTKPVQRLRLVKLVPRVDKATVRHLEEFLAQAKTGEIQSVMMIGEYPDKMVKMSHTGPRDMRTHEWLARVLLILVQKLHDWAAT